MYCHGGTAPLYREIRLRWHRPISLGLGIFSLQSELVSKSSGHDSSRWILRHEGAASAANLFLLIAGYWLVVLAMGISLVTAILAHIQVDTRRKGFQGMVVIMYLIPGVLDIHISRAKSDTRGFPTTRQSERGSYLHSVEKLPYFCSLLLTENISKAR